MDESSGSEVAFAVVVVVMLQALFTISVLVASKNKCMLFKPFLFLIIPIMMMTSG